jgi:3D (Asp-Asp-Asp) domain-containing protein
MNKTKYDLTFGWMLCLIIFVSVITLCVCTAAAPLKPVNSVEPAEATQSVESTTHPAKDYVAVIKDSPVPEARVLPLPKSEKRIQQAEPKESQQEEFIETPVEVEATVEPLTALGEFVITYYCSCVQCCDEWALNRPIVDGVEVIYTASGARAQEGITIAVDPTKIPYGTVLYIEGIGYRVAQDCGGAINGNRIDVYMSSHEAACAGGYHTAEVYVVNP